jgi:hypothetical protein
MSVLSNYVLFAFRHVAWSAAAALALYAQTAPAAEEAIPDQPAPPPVEVNAQPENAQEDRSLNAEEQPDPGHATTPEGSSESISAEKAPAKESAAAKPDASQTTREPVSKPPVKGNNSNTTNSASAGTINIDSNRTSAAPSQSASAQGSDFTAFKIIAERNIFDPNRSPRRRDSATARPKTVDQFALVGVMSYDKGPVAFFDGSTTQYRKALRTKDKIADWNIEAIEADAVKLASGTNKVHLAVGGRMRRPEGGDWSPVDPGESRPANGANSAEAKPAQSDAGSAEPDNDVLKRLMQRREQE